MMSYVMGHQDAKDRPPHPRGTRRGCAAILGEMPWMPGACGFSAQLLGAKTVQRDYDGTPMITDLMSEGRPAWPLPSVLREKGRGIIQVLGERTRS